MTPKQAESMRLALAGSYDADHDVAAAACLQAADDLELVTEAIHNGVADHLVSSMLLALAGRLRGAAQLAGAIKLACDEDDDTARGVRQ